MAISLQKGQKISLTKDNPGLTKILVGLGWDPVKKSSGGGLFGSIFGGGSGGANIDCDASVFMLKDGKLKSNKDLIYFGNLKSLCGSVVHTGDNITGDGDGDDEQIMIDLGRIPADFNRLEFVVNIYNCVQRKQDFGMIGNAFIRVVNPANGQELCKFNLTDNYAGKTSLITGAVYNHNGEWKFDAIGEGTTDSGLESLAKRYA